MAKCIGIATLFASWQDCQQSKVVANMSAAQESHSVAFIQDFKTVTRWAACARGTVTLNTSDDMRHHQDQEPHSSRLAYLHLHPAHLLLHPAALLLRPSLLPPPPLLHHQTGPGSL